MIKNKLVISLLSIAVTIGIFSTTASASSQEISKVLPTNEESTLTTLESITNQSKFVEIINVKDLPKGTPVVKFDSTEEFEKAVADLEKENKTLIKDVGNLEWLENNPIYNTYATTRTTKVLTVMVNPSINPLKGPTQPASIKANLDFSYTGSGTGKKFSSINKVISNSSGFPTDWVQTNYHKSFLNTNKTVRMTINGYNVLGVVIGSQPIGLKVNDTIIFDYKINQTHNTVFDIN